MQQTVIKTLRMSLYFHPLESIIHHEMHAYPGMEILEQILMGGLKLMREQGAFKWLSDDRNGGALPRSHHEWGDHVWSPQAVNAGWRYWALLPPSDALGTANMNRLVTIYANRGVTVKLFADYDEAFNWLRQPVQTSFAKR